jgi:hypothetical protein
MKWIWVVLTQFLDPLVEQSAQISYMIEGSNAIVDQQRQHRQGKTAGKVKKLCWRSTKPFLNDL